MYPTHQMLCSEQKKGEKPLKILSEGILTLPIGGIFLCLHSPEAEGEANFTSWCLSASHISGLVPFFFFFF